MVAENTLILISKGTAAQNT